VALPRGSENIIEPKRRVAMNESKHLFGHPNLVVRKAEVLPVWDWPAGTPEGSGKKVLTGEVVIRVTVGNIGKREAGASRTSIALIKAQGADLLDSIETPEIAEGRDFAIESRKLALKDPGSIVILADAPVDGNANGRVREHGTLTSRAGEMDNAFAFPFDGMIEGDREYMNPTVH
jgi:hypothetical protein